MKLRDALNDASTKLGDLEFARDSELAEAQGAKDSLKQELELQKRIISELRQNISGLTDQVGELRDELSEAHSTIRWQLLQRDADVEDERRRESDRRRTHREELRAKSEDLARKLLRATTIGEDNARELREAKRQRDEKERTSEQGGGRACQGNIDGLEAGAFGLGSPCLCETGDRVLPSTEFSKNVGKFMSFTRFTP
jgi:chromosome segregation ATPase